MTVREADDRNDSGYNIQFKFKKFTKFQFKKKNASPSISNLNSGPNSNANP